MTTLLVAMVGGSIAVLLTWAARLESWIADATVKLERDLAAVTADMASRGLVRSGGHGFP